MFSTSLSMTANSAFIHTVLEFIMRCLVDTTQACILIWWAIRPFGGNLLNGEIVPGLMDKKVNQLFCLSYLKESWPVDCYTLYNLTSLSLKEGEWWKDLPWKGGIVLLSCKNNFALFFPYSPYVLYCFLSMYVCIYIYIFK